MVRVFHLLYLDDAHIVHPMKENIPCDTPEFSSGSYSERAARLFSSSHSWQKRTEEHRPGHELFTRAVRWSRRPAHHRVEQAAVLNPDKVKLLQHQMFRVTLLDTLIAHRDKSRLENWFIVTFNNTPEQIFHSWQSIDAPDTQEALSIVSSAGRITADKPLNRPSSTSLMKLGDILEQGYLDGYEVEHSE